MREPDLDAGLSLADEVERHPQTLSAEVDGEVVTLDIARGACYALDAVGARVWALIETATSITEVCETLVAEYDVDPATCRQDVLDLMRDLLAEGMITVRPARLPET